MNKIITGIVIALVAVLAIIGIVGIVHKNSLRIGDSSTSFTNGIIVGGGTYAVSPALTVTGNETVSGTFAVGSAGTSVNQVNFGICNLIPDATTIAGTSTARVTCQAAAATSSYPSALTGVTSTSNITATLSTTTASANRAVGVAYGGGLVLLGVTASTTSGYIEALIYNATGGTFTWPTSAGLFVSQTMQYTAIK